MEERELDALLWISYNEDIELFVAQQYISSALPASDKIPKKPTTILSFNCQIFLHMKKALLLTAMVQSDLIVFKF